MFEITSTLKFTYPGAHAGVLVIKNVSNPPQCAALETQKEILENQIRRHFAGKDRSALLALPVIQAYEKFYKRFNKTYHVQLQVESIAFKGKTIPNVASLVEAMFMAEVKNMLLTAGHDLDAIDLPITMEVARGDERYTLLRGQEQILKAGDMFMADQTGIISSIIYGPDKRTPIKNGTRNASSLSMGSLGLRPRPSSSTCRIFGKMCCWWHPRQKQICYRFFVLNGKTLLF